MHRKKQPLTGSRWHAKMWRHGPVLVLLLGLLGCGQADQDADVTCRAGPLGCGPSGQDANVTCHAGDAACLMAAITTAQAQGQPTTIHLEAGTYLLTAVDNDTEGPTGLPAITSPWPLTIQDAGAATTIIARDASAPAFRLLRVAAPGTLTLQGLTLRGGGGSSSPPTGGGIYNTGTLSLAQSTLADNQGSDGGGIYNTGTLTLTDCTLTGNRANVSGGGIANRGTVTLTNCTLATNSVGTGSGGGIANAGTLTLTAGALTGNRAYFDGGGLVNTATGTGTLTNCTLAANTCAHCGGGGIANDGALTLTDCALTGNHANVGGGGIANRGTVTLTNCTLAANSVGPGFGGGIANRGTVTLTNCTLAANISGISTAFGSTTLQNTILALNTFSWGMSSDCAGAVTSLGNNLIGTLTGCALTLQASDLTGDPGLDAFTDDGTPGHGHFPLLATSRAIDAGHEGACPPTDQLGQPRAGRCDIGAIEFRP